MKTNSVVNSVVWGPPMLILILFTGVYFTVRTKFFQISKLTFWFRSTFLAIFRDRGITKTKDKKNITQFQSLTTALAGAMGIGNIVGVATAIVSGGPGAVFWMWVSAFFGMMTSYAENVLANRYRYKNKNNEWIGGAMVYIEHGLNMKWLAVCFSVFCICGSFGMGNMAQVNSIAAAVEETVGLSPRMTGAVLCVLAGLVILGGFRRIASVTEKLIPLISMLYLLGSITVLLLNASELLPACRQILHGAFQLGSVGGGIMGYGMALAMRYGISRGVFSNEAGLGSSVMANSTSDVKDPVQQGMWGIFEVFFDTIIVCTVTALVILTTGVVDTGKTGAALTVAAFSKNFGVFGTAFVSLSIVIFAFSTLLGWSYYGERGLTYLAGERFTYAYRVLFIAAIFIGCTTKLELVWDISDTCNGLMALPNIIALLLLSDEVIKITRSYFAPRSKRGRFLR